VEGMDGLVGGGGLVNRKGGGGVFIPIAPFSS